MISVCLASYNGTPYVAAQLQSILQSASVSEVLVSDDGSTDATIDVVTSIHDQRIKLLHGPKGGLIRNFEYLLSNAVGEYIFLSDQDDVWMPEKVDRMIEALQSAVLVVSDCEIVDANLRIIKPSIFDELNSGPGILRNLIKNRYLGCCMAFRRSLLASALPFPAKLPMHDWWLGLIAETQGRVAFIAIPLLKYRRHGSNASSTSERSPAGWSKKILWRWNLIAALLLRISKIS